MAILGIHHVTAIATDPQTNVDFYAGTLGLRLGPWRGAASGERGRPR